MEGIFITGIDTGVGKTVVAAGLLKAVHGHNKAAYWKPVQTGTIVGDDTGDIRAMLEISDDSFIEPVYRFPDPVSPHYAAKKWGKVIEVAEIGKRFDELRAQGRFLIVEGAGGLLVPYSETELQADLISRTKLPLLIVASDRVGAINQCLLTLNACRDHGFRVLGIVMTKSRGNLGNAEAIAHFGKVEILAELPPSENSRSVAAQVSVHPRLRKMLGLPDLPM